MFCLLCIVPRTKSAKFHAQKQIGKLANLQEKLSIFCRTHEQMGKGKIVKEKLPVCPGLYKKVKIT
jgi:hypothetical protein